MKQIIVVATAILGLASTARAQWTVYDPAVHSQQIISTAQEIAKFVEMINNQVQQIQQLTEQVETLHHYVDLFGDPATFAPGSINALAADLTRTELGQTLTSLQAKVDAVEAMDYTGHGLFSSVAEQFTTPNGIPVERRGETYRPVAAVQRTTEN
jgi:P-type conjugative transfer protein TrbJ